MVTSLSKFNPKTSKQLKEHKKLIGGRYHYKGKPMGHFKRGKSGNPSGVPLVPGENGHDRAKRKYVPTERPRGNPNMVKGAPRVGGTKAGVKKGTTKKYRIEDLIEAIQEVEREEGIELLKHFIKRALKSDPSLNNLMKKLLPDLKSVEAKGDAEAPFKLIVELPPD